MNPANHYQKTKSVASQTQTRLIKRLFKLLSSVKTFLLSQTKTLMKVVCCSTQTQGCRCSIWVVFRLSPMIKQHRHSNLKMY